jgi:hypothetical protein
MANGLLGKAMSVANNFVKVYEVPSTGVAFATASYNALNMDIADVFLKVAISTSETPSPADFIDFNAKIPLNGGIIERTCVAMSPGEKMFFQADSSNVSIRVHGLEKAV